MPMPRGAGVRHLQRLSGVLERRQSQRPSAQRGQRGNTRDCRSCVTSPRKLDWRSRV